MMKKVIKILSLLAIFVIGGGLIFQPLSSKLTMDDLKTIIELKGIDNVSWDDFKRYSFQDIGSGNYVYQYELVDGSHLYLSGSDLDSPPTYIYVIDEDGNRSDLKK